MQYAIYNRLEEEGYKQSEASNDVENVQPIEAAPEKVSLKELADNIHAYFALVFSLYLKYKYR